MTMRALLLGSTRSMHSQALELVGSASCFVRRSTAQPVDLQTPYDRLVFFADQAPVEEWVRVAQVFHDGDPYGAVCSYTDEDMPIAAAIASRLGVFSTIRPELVAATLDKEETRRMARRAGLDSTACRAVGDVGEIREFARELGYPLILKPRKGTGSAGVSKLSQDQDIEPAVGRLEAVGEGFPAVLETFIEGEVFGVDALSEGGSHRILGICGVVKDQAARFVSQGHVLPAPLSADDGERIRRFIGALLDVIGVLEGPSHTEVILSASGPVLLETHVRVGGDHLSKLFKLAFDLQVPELVARQSLGEKVFHRFPEVPSNHRFAAVWYQSPSESGILRQIRGVDEASSMAGVHFVQVGSRVGERIRPVTWAADRPACAIAHGSSAEEALGRARRAIEAIRLEVEPG
jgi:biotin carboxylase